MGNIFLKSSNNNNILINDPSSLENYNINNTNQFSMNNILSMARVVDIYDGDTCTCIIPLFNNYYQFRIRLADIDTCEKTSKNIENKSLAYKARKRLAELISDDFKDIELEISKKDLIKRLNDKCYIIKIKFGSFDKYGRLLGYLFKKDIIDEQIENSFNYILINEKLAYKYNDENKLKKLTEVEQIALLNK